MIWFYDLIDRKFKSTENLPLSNLFDLTIKFTPPTECISF